METWNERLTRAREDKKLNKTALAKAVGVSQPTVSDWESGVMKPNGDNLLAVCRILGITPDWLTTGRESGTTAPPPAGEPARPPTIADLLAGLKGEIDAPERGQPFYKQSKESLAEMCFGKPAKLKQTSYDSRFNRPVVRMQCGELDTNLEQVRHGMAWVFDKYVTDKSLYPIQDEARSARHGLWVDESPVPPWEWRKRARQNLSDAGESLEHGGGLNTCGCHFNRKTGECHCHQPRQCGCECQPAECRR